MLACLLSGSALLQAEDERTLVRLNFPKTDLRDVLAFYGRLVRKPVLMDVQIQAWVTVDREKELPLKEAVELIRKTLLESYGIEMRDSDRGEVLVTWSSDPKYPHHSDAPETGSRRGSFNVNGIQVRRKTVPLPEPEGSK
ncbi:hypothetical protein CfE428DRAFT_4285 [Chthoniobacter flavus Ellin428]|uniref:Uncharacterized protein n=2 Tax=Chthoniobacter flavus TaxID=191863 RepID=B4D5U6_9BACT|nr:hypothetical protein CfE428DRAFT_4285 [Chthoniobacter flavus Ellin428]TCO91497.1 hypothetical protein EV701_108225 [Chthoniobacter flavus]